MTSSRDIEVNLKRVRELMSKSALRAARDPAAIRLIAVSKTFPAERIMAAYECGQRDFGENRVQEFREKLPQLSLPDARFHFIGHLQSNKVSQAMVFDYIETVDSERLALRLNDAAAKAGKVMPVLIEVKLGMEESKTGIAEPDTQALAAQMASLDHLQLRGLMTIPPYMPDPEAARPCFRRLRELRDRLQNAGLKNVEELSMGMSRDFPIAIEEGATMVRIGTAIFGPRSQV